MSRDRRFIEGSWGIFEVDADGNILSKQLEDVADEPHNGYHAITRFDIAEYIAWCHREGVPECVDHDLDILEVGYWEGDKYEPAEDDFRNEYLARRRNEA